MFIQPKWTTEDTSYDLSVPYQAVHAKAGENILSLKPIIIGGKVSIKRLIREDL